MRVQFLQHFSKDLDKVNQPRDKKSILDAIDLVKEAGSSDQIPGLRKLIGFPNAYRLRCGDYRIGIFIEDDIVQFARVAHRKEIYRIFP